MKLFRVASLLFCFTILVAKPAAAQLIVNEANAVSANNFLDIDTDKPYEGFDFGVLAYSGLNNPVNHPVPGNPFPDDVDAGPNVVTSLPNGWNLAQPTGWARIEGNGGDWMELVVTEDHTDLRGYTIYWENDEDIDFITGENPDERGFIKLLNNKEFADLRAGTIITLSESDFVDEIRDQYPVDTTPEPLPGQDRIVHDTGYDYSLLTDTQFDPFSSNDWHKHFHVDETQTDVGNDTEYFGGFSDVKVDGDDWTVWIFDPSNTTVIEEAEDSNVGSVSDLATGLVQGPIGEAIVGWGNNTGAGGVGGDETMSLLGDPVTGAVPDDYEDLDFSTFGAPNMFNTNNNEATLGGAQDFSALRTPVLTNTHDWTATGTANVNSALNWVNAASGATPATGPQAAWTLRLNNTSGGANVAEVTTDVSVEFAAVMATAGTMTVDVKTGATFTATGNTTAGRVLVMGGGAVNVDGTVDADQVEAFAGGQISGGGLVTGDLQNSGGTVAAGSNGVGTLNVGGDYVQESDSTLAITISGSSQFGLLDVEGAATVAGSLEVSLDGFTPANGSMFTVLTSASLTDLGIGLTGASGFSLSVTGTELVLSFESTTPSPDFNDDGELDCLDIDALVVEIAGTTNAAAFDLTGDGLVDLADRDAWLAAAGAANLSSQGAYLLGDADLDGTVDGGDFLTWNNNKFSAVAAWCQGDFNASGFVDGGDFLIWNNNKFMSADGVAAVPEPTAFWLMLTALGLIGWRRR